MESIQIWHQNLSVRGRELAVYYSKQQCADSTESCRFCGAKPAFAADVNVTSICDENYTDVRKSNPLWNEAQACLRKKELHGKPACTDDLCQKKHMHELLGEEAVLNMIASGEYVPDADHE